MKVPKIIAHYLPQFHRIPENDAWWGEGFTEWTAVRGSVPLFAGHVQPRIPLHGNYYDLSQKATMVWQVALAREYGIDGFTFYHYWFRDGKKLLETPAEHLLAWKDIDLPFCFCWANETWARLWSNLRHKNAWLAAESENRGGRDDGILMEQKYGEREEWVRHIEYLLTFFRDERYIKKDNRPIFMLYRPQEIFCLADMLECWNDVLTRHGFDGIFLIGETTETTHPDLPEINAWLYRSGFRPSDVLRRENGVRLYDYEADWERMLREMDDMATGETYACPIVNFDNTPRWGSRGMAYANASAECFRAFFSAALQKATAYHHEYIFLNAWNEWGEGNYLEPDEENGFAYLEAVRAARRECEDMSCRRDASSTVVDRISRKTDLRELERKRYIADCGFALLDAWMRLRAQGKRVADYLCARGFRRVAVYGLGRAGLHLLEELQDSEIVVQYVIDSREDATCGNIPVYPLSSKLPKAEVVIVTPTGQYSEIRGILGKYMHCPTVSLEHIIYELC